MAEQRDQTAVNGAVKHEITCLGNDQFDRARELHAKGEFFWIDLRAATDPEIAEIGEALKLHPLTIEDLQHFGQRPKAEDYQGYVYFVSYGAAPSSDSDRLAEVHIVYSPTFLLTASRDASIELHRLHERSGGQAISGHALLHSVVDTLVDSFTPLLDEIDEALEAIEDHIFAHELTHPERELHRLRRNLVRIDRVVQRQSDAYARLGTALSLMPDHSEANDPYFRDIQDHMIRINEMTEGLRDRLQGVFDIYTSALDNRLNGIMKQFTVIAGIFLPLSVLVGFFGQNFAWMEEHIQSFWSFALLGLILPAVILIAMLVAIFRLGIFRD